MKHLKNLTAIHVPAAASTKAAGIEEAFDQLLLLLSSMLTILPTFGSFWERLKDAFLDPGQTG
jgi:hypothetical protein